MGKVEVKIDQETLSQQQELTDEQIEAIALQGIAEADAEAAGVKKDPDEDKGDEDKGDEDKGDEDKGDEEAALSDEELLSAKEEDLTDEQKSKKIELVKQQQKDEEERILNAKEEDLSEEDKTKKAEIVKTRDEAAKIAAEQEITNYAKEHNISAEQAKEDIESISKIQEKYKSDPKQLAKANLHQQRGYARLEAEMKALKEQKQIQAQEVTIEQVEQFIEDGKLQMNGKSVSKEAVIEAYRKAYPDITETLEDDKVLKLAARETKQAIDKANEKQREEMSVKAREKRSTMFNNVAEADKPFVEQVKPLIEKLSDTQIMHENFDLDTYITYAKGKAHDELMKKYEAEKKEFGEKEYKRGREEAKILGSKSTPSGGKKPAKTISLTAAQKKRAVEMFDNPQISEEKAYQLYYEHLKETGQLQEE